jgi:hypothetical protein
MYKQQKWFLIPAAASGMVIAMIKVQLGAAKCQEEHSDRPFVGLTGRWRFPEMTVGRACWNVRFQVFRIVTIDTHPTVKVEHQSGCFTAESRPSIGR